MTVSMNVKRADAASYDATASAFAVLTDRFSQNIAARMLDVAGVRHAERLLDVGTGTGLVARLAAARGAEALGIDHSTGMLEQAQSSADRQGVGSRTEFKAMDAEALDIEDASFDLVTSLFVLRHLPDPRAAVREMRRVLRPDGRLVISVGARPEPFTLSGFRAVLDGLPDRLLGSIGWRALAPATLREFLRQEGLGAGHSHAAHAAHAESIEVGQLLGAAGFAHVQKEWWGQRFALSPEEFWDVQAVFDSEARDVLNGCAQSHREELRSRFISHCESLAGRGVALIYRTGALIYSASR